MSLIFLVNYIMCLILRGEIRRMWLMDVASTLTKTQKIEVDGSLVSSDSKRNKSGSRKRSKHPQLPSKGKSSPCLELTTSPASFVLFTLVVLFRQRKD